MAQIVSVTPEGVKERVIFTITLGGSTLGPYVKDNSYRNWYDQVTDALKDHSKEVYSTSDSYAEYRGELQRAADVAGYVIDSMGNLRTTYGKMIQQNYMLSESQFELNKGVEYTRSVHEELSPVVYTAADANSYYANSIASVVDQEYGLNGAQLVRIQTAGLMAGIQGTLGDATTNYSATLEQLTTQETTLTQALDQATLRYGENSAKVQELNAALLGSKDARTVEG